MMKTLLIALLVVAVDASAGTRNEGGQPEGLISLDTTVGVQVRGGLGMIGSDEPNSLANLGQTFTAPAGAGSVQSLSFWLHDGFVSDDVSYSVHLAQWDGTGLLGPLLYSSAARITTGQATYERIDFQLPSIPVQEGSEYLAFLRTSAVTLGQEGDVYVGTVVGDVMPDGRAYGGQVIVPTLEVRWGYLQPSTDLAFRAEFLPVPEPPSGLLMSTSVFGIWHLLRRRDDRPS